MNLFFELPEWGNSTSAVKNRLFIRFLFLFLALLSLAAQAQTIPSSVTVSGACLSGTYTLTKVADDFESTGRPAYSGTGDVTINSTVYSGVDLALYYVPSGTSWVLSFGGQPYQASNSTATVPPMTGYTAVVGDGTVGTCSGSNPLSVSYGVAAVSARVSAASVCSGSPFSVTVTTSTFSSPATSYTLSSNPTGLTGSNATGVFSLNAPSVSTATTYTLTVGAFNSSESASTTAVITVMPTPTLTAGTGVSSTRCDLPNGQLNFTTNLANGNYSLRYQRNADNPQTVTIAVSNGQFSLTGLSGGNYYGFSLTNNGCTGVSSNTLSISNPSPPTVSITPSTTAICAGQSAQLMASGAATYVWSLNQQTSASISVTATGMYSVTGTASNGCSGTATANVTVNPLPTPAIVGLSAAYCKDAMPVTLAGDPSGGTFTLDGATATSFNPASLTVGQHTVVYSYTNANGCINTTNKVVTVNQVPSSPVINSLAAAYCKDATPVTLSGTPAGGAFTIDGNTATTLNPASLSVGQHTVVYSYTNNSGCSAATSQTVTINALPTPTIDGLAMTYCQGATPVSLMGSPTGGVFTIDGTPATTLTPNSLSVGQHTVVYSYTNNTGCSATASQPVTIKQTPTAPSVVTQSGHPYPAGVSSLTASQNTGDVVLMVSGCSGGTLSWSGGASSTLSVSTANTGVFTYTANCSQNGCTSPLATATITVIMPTLTVSHLDATYGQFNSNTIKPYLQLNNVGGNPISYNTITVRYWLTVEGNSPITNFQTYYVQLGANNLQTTYMPLAQARQGATAYVEYSFLNGAGSLNPMSNSGPIQNGFLKADYSVFNQADDYSYVTNRDYTLNPRITAYINGQLVYGQEPTVPGTGPQTPLSVSLTATAPVFPTSDNTTLVAQASGGSGVYSYVFSGPGTITPNGNTAVASGQSAGVKTFTLVVTDTSTPTAMQATATVSVTVTGLPNTAPVATGNANQTATVGTQFSYTAQAFTDTETPNSLTYSASISPTNGFGFDPATRMITGTPSQTGVSSVTITATNPGGLSASTSFSITVNPAPVMGSGQLTVSHLDATYGQLNTNTIKPYLQLTNTGQTAIPYSSIKLRYYLTKDGTSPITNFETYYVQLGASNVRVRYVALASPVVGADAYIEYSFDGAAGSLAPGANSGPIQTGFLKQDYSAFDQSNDYSYVLNRDYTLNSHITAYVNNQLVFGTPPLGAPARVASSEPVSGQLSVRVLGNPVTGQTAQVEISGAEGQAVRLELTDLQGRSVHQQRIDQAGVIEQVSVPVGGTSGLFLLQVATPTQRQQIKLLKP